MFSTNPSRGTPRVWNISTARITSVMATPWGVVTINAPASGTSCARESWVSPGATADQRQRQVDCHGGFSNAALSGGHGDDLAHPGNASLLRQAGAGGYAGFYFDTYPGYARNGCDRLASLSFKLIAEGTRRRGQAQGEGDGRAVHLQIPDHTQRDKVTAQFGIIDPGEGFVDLIGSEYCGSHRSENPGVETAAAHGWWMATE